MDLQGIELSHLRYFVVLAEELHFGRAAGRLHMAQPPLTRQIQLLERRLECVLFERSSRSTRLSAAGELLLQRARAILAEADSTFQTLRSAGRGEEGHLAVATAPSLMLGALPRVIQAYRRQYPRIAFRLTEMASSAILQALRAGSIDVGFVRGLDKDPELETYLQWREEMVAIVPKDHALARKTRLKAAQLRGEPFVFFPRDLGPAFYDEVAGLLGKAAFDGMVAQEARQWSSIVSLVSAGMGISVGPRPVASLLPEAVRYVPLERATTTARVAGGRGGGANPVLARFLALADEIYRSGSI
ncbi:MAG: LysR family transcriptional regulator [Bryobacterales bacterium]|nr:LysR family transcriptional regulator [Bryobacterales bacterium]